MSQPSRQNALFAALSAGAFAIALSACAPKPAPEPAAEPAPAPAQTAPPADAAATPDASTGDGATMAACNADAVQSLVGQEATEAVLEQAKTGSGAALVRALKPGEPATMEFRADRIDIRLDENNVIQSLHCG